MAGKAFFCLLAMFYPNPVLRVPTVSVVFALLRTLLIVGCYLHWGPRSSEESSALQPQRHVRAGYHGPAGATGSRFTHSRGSSNPCWCMEATLSIPGNRGIGSARLVDVLHRAKKPQRNGERNGKWEAQVSSAETDYDGREREHCCCLDFPLNEFVIIAETAGENICINELLLGRKGVYQLP